MNKFTYLVLAMLILWPTHGLAQICDTYDGGDFFVPNSLTTLPNDVHFLTAAGGAFFACGNFGVAKLTVDGDLLTELNVLGGSASRRVSVSGDLLVSDCSGSLELMHSITGQIFSSIPISENSVCRLDGTDLVIWDTTALAIYDVQDPSAPALVGEIEFSLPVVSVQPMPDSVKKDDCLYAVFSGGGTSIASARGCLVVFDLHRRAQPRIIDTTVEFPFSTEEGRWWSGVHSLGDRIFVNGGACFASCMAQPLDGFVGEIHLQPDERLAWGSYCLFPHSRVPSLAAWNDKIIAEVSSYTWPGPGFSSLYQITFPEFLETPSFVKTLKNHQRGRLASIPGKSLLAVGSSLQKMLRLNQDPPPPTPEIQNHTTRVLLERNGLGYQLQTWNGQGHDDPNGWMVSVYDLSSTPPQRLSRVWDVWYTISHMNLVGNRLYYSSGDKYLDISDPRNISGPQDSEFPLGEYAMQWDGLVVASNNNSELCGYLPGPDESLQLLWTLSVPQGRLYRFGDFLLVSNSHNSRFVDLSDPLTPSSPVFFSRKGMFKAGPENTLFAASGTTLYWYDHSVPTAPHLLGSWEMGAVIGDLEVSGDRVYVGLNGKGLSVLAFDPQLGFSPIGGELNHAAAQLVLLESGLWLGGNVTLPLECDDPLPTLVSLFSLEKVGSETWVSWNAQFSGQSGSEFKLTRSTSGEPLILGQMPLRNGEYRVQDPGPCSEGPVQYRLELCTDSGECFTMAEIQEENPGPLSGKTRLNFSPNPANPGTLVQFNLTRQEDVTLDVYTLAGKHVSRLVQGTLSAGRNTAFWDGTDHSGRTVSSGVYLFALESESQRFTGRVVVAK